MALHLLDGFETYGDGSITGASLEILMGQIWSDPGITVGTDAFIATPGRSGYCLQMPDDLASFLRHDCETAQTTWIVGFAIYAQAWNVPHSANYMYQAMDATSGTQLTLRYGPAANLQIALGSGAWIEESAPLSMQPRTWNYVEIKFTIDDTVGSYEVRINGLLVMSATGINTDFTEAGEVSQHQFTGAITDQLWDDIYICDDTGAEFNDWLGPNTILALVPNADTAQLDWSVEPVGNHYAAIDSTNEASYVYESIASQEDLYGYADLAITPDSIVVIDVWTQAALDSAGSESLVVTCQSGATHSDGATDTVTDIIYKTLHRQMSQDPNTASAWLPTGLNAAQFGVKIG